MKIKVINPNTTPEMTHGIEEAGRLAARLGTEILAVSPESGPASIESYYDEYLCIPGVLEEVKRGEDDAEAVLLGCVGMAKFASSIEDELGVPVIDGVVVAVKFAESVADLGKKTSKRETHRPPERKTFSGSMAGFGSA